MKRLFLIGAMICAMGLVCSCNGRLDGSEQENSSVQKTRPVDWEGLYSGSEGDVDQVLMVSVSKDEMSFNYAVATNGDSLCYALSGRAILKVGDLEWDEDDNGVAYAVDEYVYDSACYMAIRIEADSHRLARIVTDDERVWKLIGENAPAMKLVK